MQTKKCCIFEQISSTTPLQFQTWLEVEVSQKRISKSNNRKDCMVCHYWFVIMGSNFKILYAMVAMMLCLNISIIAIIVVKGVEIIVVLFMTLGGQVGS